MKMNDVYFEKIPIKIVSTVNLQVIVKNVKEPLNMVKKSDSFFSSEQDDE